MQEKNRANLTSNSSKTSPIFVISDVPQRSSFSSNKYTELLRQCDNAYTLLVFCNTGTARTRSCPVVVNRETTISENGTEGCALSKKRGKWKCTTFSRYKYIRSITTSLQLCTNEIKCPFQHNHDHVVYRYMYRRIDR